ncbi:chromosome segregation protein Spc25-domain-containing protein [Pilaira anomala]|nr:chromosome segregation protein Spc25-domain-containing protein [Pilaira anomala]
MEDLTTSKLCLDVKKSLELFKRLEEAFNYKLTKKEQTFTTVIETVDKRMTQFNENKSTLRKELEDKAKSISHLEKELSLLKETNKSLELTDLKAKVDLAQKENKRLQTLLNEKQTLLEKKRTESLLKSSSSEEYKKKAEAELKAYAKYLQLEISTVEENHVKFSFRGISDTEPKKIVYFLLHVNGTDVFEVKTCQPELANLNQLISQLNRDRNLTAFIKRMRKEFVEVENN